MSPGKPGHDDRGPDRNRGHHAATL
jgi:hypothetical protein